MSDIARNKRGHAVMVRTDKRDLTVDERHQFVAAVEKGSNHAHHSPDGFSRYPPRTRARARETQAGHFGHAPVPLARLRRC